ncbi:MAG: Calx-beta domain-containing protein, partial [Oleispira sp.]
MNIIFINNKLFFLSVILAFIAGCSDGSKSSGGPVVGIADLSPGIAVSSSVDLEEGDDGSQIAAVGFTASTDGIVNYTTYDIDAVAKSDYLPQSGQYEMQAGQSYEIGIEILSDTRVEADEKVGVLITDESGEELGRLVATILNDDYPNYTLTASDITEGHLGAQFLEFTIELSEPTVAPFPLSVTTTDLVQVGSALAGTDYTAINTQLVFVAGELTKTVEVEVFGDRDIELDETIELKVEHLAISEVVASGTIRSDDTPGNGAPTFRFNEGRSITIAENGTPEELVMKFKIDESGGFTEDFVVNYRLAGLASDVVISGDETGKAEEEQDFSTAVGQITILAAQDSLANEYTASFELVDDELLENNEVLEMVLFNDAGVEFGSGRIYIVDDESPEFKIYRKYTDLSGEEQITTDLTYLEDSDYLGRREFYVELAGQVGYDYQFELVLRYLNDGEEGNAIDPDDVQGSGGANQKIISKIIDIEKGNSFSVEEGDHVISFSMEEDSLVEANERMMIELRSSNGGTLGEAIPVNILNDDLPVIRWANTDFSTDVFESNEETPLNLILQLDNDELPVDQQYGDSALEDFDISIVRSITQGSESKVCSVKTQSDLSTEELIITTEGLQVYSASSNSVPVILAFVDDTDAECDEVVDLTVTLKSQSSRVNGYLAQEEKGSRSDKVTVTSKNTDEATLTITGFNVTEDLDGGVVNFTAILNQNITLDAAFSVSSDGAEAGGADDNGDGVITYNTNPIAFDVANTFEFSGGVKERNISIAINNDSIVEIDENYILNVVMDDGYPVKLASISTVTTKTCDAIGLGCLQVGDEVQTTSVEGKIVSEDKAQISIQGGATIDESALDVHIPTYPFTVSFQNEIADDVPDIILEVTSNCPILTGDICAEDGDFIRSDTSLPKIEATFGVASAVLGLSFYNDDLVEASETAHLQVSLKNASALSEYVDSWSNINLTYAITNDDKIKPYFVGTVANDKISTSGSETDATHIPGISKVAIRWDEAVAKNVPSNLILNLSAACLADGSGCDNSDYSLVNKTIYTTGQSVDQAAPTANQSIGFQVVGGTMVEPNEAVTLSFAASDATYFDVAHFDSAFKTALEYTIENNDKIKPYFVGSVNDDKISASGSETDTTHIPDTSKVAVRWDEAIAKNVPSNLTLHLTAACLEDGSGCDTTDYSLTNKLIYTAGQGADQAAPTADQAIGFQVTGGTVVEPNETVTLSFAASNDSYFDVTHFDVAFKTALEYTIENNDKIKPYFVGTVVDNKISVSGSETDTTHTPEISKVAIRWDEVIAKNVPASLTLNIQGDCLADSSGCDETAGVDYTLANKVIYTTGQTADQVAPTTNQPISFQVTGGTMVEPNETVTLSFAASDAIYFDVTHFDSAFKTALEYTIENNDKIKPYFVGTVANDKISTSGSETDAT